MRRNAFPIAASLVALSMLAARPALASIVVSLDDTITLTGSFASPGTSPFGSGPFTLSLTVPTDSLASGYALNQLYQINAFASGTYTNGSGTRDFTRPSISVIGTSPDAIQITGFIGGLAPPSVFTVDTLTAIFTATSEDGGASTLYQFITGSPAMDFASADQVLPDPPIANPVLTITGQQNSVPEPASLILLGGPLAALGVLRRRARRDAR